MQLLGPTSSNIVGSTIWVTSFVQASPHSRPFHKRSLLGILSLLLLGHFRLQDALSNENTARALQDDRTDSQSCGEFEKLTMANSSHEYQSLDEPFASGQGSKRLSDDGSFKPLRIGTLHCISWKTRGNK